MDDYSNKSSMHERRVAIGFTQSITTPLGSPELYSQTQTKQAELANSHVKNIRKLDDGVAPQMKLADKNEGLDQLINSNQSNLSPTMVGKMGDNFTSVTNTRDKSSSRDREAQSSNLTNSHNSDLPLNYPVDISGLSPKMKTTPVSTNEECWDTATSSKRGKIRQLKRGP